MCFLCLQNNPLETIKTAGAWGGAFGGEEGRIKAEIHSLKKTLLGIETQEKVDGKVCNKGEKTIAELRELQYALARLL